MGGFILAEGTVHHDGDGVLQERHGAGGRGKWAHCVSTGEVEADECCSPASTFHLFFFSQSGTLVHGMVQPTFRMCLFSSVKSLWKPSQVHTGVGSKD